MCKKYIKHRCITLLIIVNWVSLWTPPSKQKNISCIPEHMCSFLNIHSPPSLSKTHYKFYHNYSLGFLLILLCFCFVLLVLTSKCAYLNMSLILSVLKCHTVCVVLCLATVAQCDLCESPLLCVVRNDSFSVLFDIQLNEYTTMYVFILLW